MNDEDASSGDGQPALWGGGNADPYRMGEENPRNPSRKTANMALSAMKRYGGPQAKLAAGVLEKTQLAGKLGKLRYLRFLGCFGAGCLPILLLILAASAVIGIAWGAINESGIASWIAEAYSWANDEFAEIMNAMQGAGAEDL